jgi:hypothetical protein
MNGEILETFVVFVGNSMGFSLKIIHSFIWIRLYTILENLWISPIRVKK